MTLQANLNDQALAQLPSVYKLLQNSSNPVYSNIYQHALNAILNCTPPLDSMSELEKARFDMFLYQSYFHQGYVKTEALTIDEALKIFPDGSFNRNYDYYKDMDVETWMLQVNNFIQLNSGK